MQGASRSVGKVQHHPTASLPLAAAGLLISGSPTPCQMGWLQEEEHPHSAQLSRCPQPSHGEDCKARPPQ